MNETHLSFYLKANRIHVFVNSLRHMGSPSRICFMISDDGHNLLITPYSKRDFKSHAVPQRVYKGDGSFEVSSYKLCRLIAGMQNWDLERSYRIPGNVLPEKKVAVFNLREAEPIEHSES